MKTLILLLLVSFSTFSQENYNDIEVRPVLKQNKDFITEFKNKIEIPDLDFQMIKISFIVDKNGKVLSSKSNTENKEFDLYLFNLIKSFGDWTSPEHKGKPVDCLIEFNLSIR